ncbi:OLC1v1010373C1 [Oldenlandia corymbosa var. corymbosa]|uniref:OLC1v1010373C1 n=1 Tax=Oldenlandia corymbosa var. corymbosa TaxID=529605 RepID=A0AAV1DTX1_OLDCO|nr:OLC1v1010373C1 [Oldenlandia corymbosa var. corymbosa]
MVWGLFRVDPLPGEERYYFFSKGTYKVGRRGCDITINKDKGVSRIHAEILIDEMVCLDNPRSQSSKVRVRDCSKYGTFVKKNQGSKEKVHEFPNKETVLSDGDMVSFGTGNATYRFSFVPIVFFYCCSKAILKPLQEQILSIGASICQKWSLNCTHVLVDGSVSLKEELIDAIAAKRPFISREWVEFIAGQTICTEIPSCASYAPTLLLEEVSVKVADPQSRGNCLNEYTFLLESEDKYKLKERLQCLLELCGGKVVSLEAFCLDSSQVLEDEGTKNVVWVIPTGSTANPKYSHNTKSLPNVKEMELLSSIISGYLDPSIILLPPVLVTSSCSTDETIVADSDAETETATSVQTSPAVYTAGSSDLEHKETVHLLDSVKQDSVEEIAMHVIHSPETDRTEDKTFVGVSICEAKIKEEIPGSNSTVNWSNVSSLKGLKSRDGTAGSRVEKIEAPECDNMDIIYSQDLIVKDSVVPSSPSPENDPVINFKRFRKMGTPSGNSFDNLIPYSKDPYKESDYGNEEVAQSFKEEKKRKQMEAMADDLFNHYGEKAGCCRFSQRSFCSWLA